jgi:hypothetical protein
MCGRQQRNIESGQADLFICFVFIYLLIFICGTGDGAQGFVLARQVLYHLSYATAPSGIY